MFYALIIICVMDAAPCDLDRAIFATQSAPIFESEITCHRGARDQLPLMNIPTLKAGEAYQIEISCEATEPPA